jgi:hypothetical protein
MSRRSLRSHLMRLSPTRSLRIPASKDRSSGSPPNPLPCGLSRSARFINWVQRAEPSWLRVFLLSKGGFRKEGIAAD